MTFPCEYLPHPWSLDEGMRYIHYVDNSGTADYEEFTFPLRISAWMSVKNQYVDHNCMIEASDHFYVLHGPDFS